MCIAGCAHSPQVTTIISVTVSIPVCLAIAVPHKSCYLCCFRTPCMHHYANLTVVRACVRACVHVYEREVTGSQSTRAKKLLLLGIAGLGCYNRQPTDVASNGPSSN